MNLNDLAQQIHENAKAKGFWHEERSTPTLLMLIVTELAEACEGDRNNIPLGEKGALDEELADAIIRILDMCAGKGIDIERAVRNKMAYNKTRPIKHGKLY
jgi:NTP pyrophosphatase (non-canonical NTP hydrolase)